MRHCSMLKAEWGMGSIRIGAAIATALLLSAAPQAHAGDTHSHAQPGRWHWSPRRHGVRHGYAVG